MAHFSKTISALQAMSGSLDEVRSKAETVRPALQEARRSVKETADSVDEFDSILARSKENQNDWSRDLELSIQQVRLGAITLDEFITKWGDAEIATGDGFETIREAFAGADFGQYRQQIQQLISDIRDGGAEVGDIVTFLKENAGDLAKGLINVLDLFKAGKASLDDVQRVLDAMKQAFPGTESDALTEAIRQALLGGELGGEI